VSSSSEESDEANGGNSPDHTKHSEDTERTGSIWSAIIESNGILKTTTIEIGIETDGLSSSSTRSSLVVPKEWEDAQPLGIEEAPTELLSMVVEQGRLTKARRSTQ
jgi:hypothetical protein